MRRQVALAGAAVLGLAVAEAGLAQDLSPQEQVVALKISLAASQAVVRQHEWIETTIVRLKGEEKSRFQNRCYYGADGQLQKVQARRRRSRRRSGACAARSSSTRRRS